MALIERGKEPQILVSFDIDGTLEVGDPPGPLTLDHVRRAKQLGYLVGSSSDRTLGEQRDIWEKAGIEVDFVSHKHHLTTVRERFEVERFVHFGDTTSDEHYATLAGFEFRFVHEFQEEWFEDGLPERL